MLKSANSNNSQGSGHHYNFNDQNVTDLPPLKEAERMTGTYRTNIGTRGTGKTKEISGNQTDKVNMVNIGQTTLKSFEGEQFEIAQKFQRGSGETAITIIGRDWVKLH